MKCMHLGEKTEDTSELNETIPPILVRKQRTCQLNETSSPILVCEDDNRISPWCTRKCHSPRAPHRAGGQAECGHSNPEMGQYFQVDGKKSKLFKNFPLIRALDDDEASVSLGQVTKLTPDIEIQVFERYRSGQVALQAEPFIDVPVDRAVFGSRKEIPVVHRDTNYFRVFAILRNAGNGQFYRDRLATMVKHVGMGKKG
ncbi:hypothetical protein TNCV_410001 [Trichonephila clavipes]|nr:hypothetical protein TNCV_410001 [Trichonephila clavipes]